MRAAFLFSMSMLFGCNAWANELDLLTHVKSVEDLLKKAKDDLGEVIVQKIKTQLGPAISVPIKVTQKNKSLFVQAGHVSVTMEFSYNDGVRSLIVNQQELSIKPNEDIISIMNKVRAVMPQNHAILGVLWPEAEAEDGDTQAGIGYVAGGFGWLGTFKNCLEINEFKLGCEEPQRAFIFGCKFATSYFCEKMRPHFTGTTLRNEHYIYDPTVMTYAAESMAQMDGHAGRCQPSLNEAKKCMKDAMKDKPTTEVAAQFLGLPDPKTAELKGTVTR
jgi:hypothetical protein